MKAKSKTIDSEDLFEISKLNSNELLNKMNSNINGLNKKEVKSKVNYYGLNKVVTDEKMSFIKKIIKDTINPLNILLIILSIISYLTKDIKATIIILVMVVLGTTLKIFQEKKADNVK